MNLSGKPSAAIATFTALIRMKSLVAHDELDLPPGWQNLSSAAATAATMVLKDIISKLGNNLNFHRLRVGISHPGDKTKLSVLCWVKPPASEQKAD